MIDNLVYKQVSLTTSTFLSFLAAGFETCDVQKRLWIYNNEDLFAVGVDAVLNFVGDNILQPPN